jgi:hypothetical protein
LLINNMVSQCMTPQYHMILIDQLYACSSECMQICLMHFLHHGIREKVHRDVLYWDTTNNKNKIQLIHIYFKDLQVKTSLKIYNE